MSVIRISLAVLIAAGVVQPVVARAGQASPETAKSVELNGITTDELACEFQQHMTLRLTHATSRVGGVPRVLEPLRCTTR